MEIEKDGWEMYMTLSEKRLKNTIIKAKVRLLQVPHDFLGSLQGLFQKLHTASSFIYYSLYK